MNRRGFLKGLAAVGTIAAAPALAREGILMPVKQVVVPKQELKIGKSLYWNLVIDNVDHARIKSEYDLSGLMVIDTDEEFTKQNVAYNKADAPVHSSYVAGHTNPSWRNQFKEAVRQYQRDMIEQSVKLNERILMRDMIAGATPASNNHGTLDYAYQPSTLAEEFFKDSTFYGQAAVDIRSVKSRSLSEEDLAKLKKRYPST